MRKIIFNDAYRVSKILRKIGIKVNADEMDDKGKKTDKSQNQFGSEYIQQFIENMDKADKEINDFLGSLFDMKGEEFGKLPIEESFEKFKEFKEVPQLASFFKLVSTLMKK